MMLKLLMFILAFQLVSCTPRPDCTLLTGSWKMTNHILDEKKINNLYQKDMVNIGKSEGEIAKGISEGIPKIKAKQIVDAFTEVQFLHDGTMKGTIIGTRYKLSDDCRNIIFDLNPIGKDKILIKSLEPKKMSLEYLGAVMEFQLVEQ